MFDFRKLKRVPEESELYKKLAQKCQENFWIKKYGAAFDGDIFMELDYPYTFCEISDISTLRDFFKHGNWAVREGVIFHDLVFINQVNGGDEWWTLKFDKNTNEYVAFESISFEPIIEDGEFGQIIGRLDVATPEQCKLLMY